VRAVVAIVVLSGCGGTLAAAESGPLDPTSIAEWNRATERASSIRLADRELAETVRIARAEPEARPRRTARVDVRFHRAGLANALRFLSDRAGFSLVIDGAMDGEVTLDLRRVDPYDALCAIAEAHGAEVTTRDAMVIVRRAR
jgi:hypothetical protein